MIPKYEYRSDALQISANRGVTTYPIRFHKHIEILYLEAGSADVSINGKNYHMESGDAYIIFPNILHAIQYSDAVRNLFLFIPELSPALYDTLSHFRPSVPILRREQMPVLVPALLQRMANLYREDSVRHFPVLASHVNSLLQEFVGAMELEERESDSDLVQQIVLSLMENYTQDLTEADLARSLGYSKYYISRVLRDTLGCNFCTLRNSYRVSKAQILLLSETKSIGEVAYACGFNNQSSFNRIFLAHCGMTPSQFRKKADEITPEPLIYLK